MTVWPSRPASRVLSPSCCADAILRELNRGGQNLFVHNRVHDIEKVAIHLNQIVPEARIAIGHGQMPEHDLEKVMVDFVHHRFDLLLATTIVESGLDIPNANTIFIDEADRYGLADLHQLRGRVGRYKHRTIATCWSSRTSICRPRPPAGCAIEEFSDMGAGFAIAMRNLDCAEPATSWGPSKAVTSPWSVTSSTANCSNRPSAD